MVSLARLVWDEEHQNPHALFIVKHLVSIQIYTFAVTIKNVHVLGIKEIVIMQYQKLPKSQP